MERQGQIERQTDAIARHQADAAVEPAADAHPLLQLQRQLGNAQVARLLAQRHADHDGTLQEQRLQRAAEEEEEVQAKRVDRAAEEEDELQAKRVDRAAEEEDELQAKRVDRAAEEEDELQAKRVDRAAEEEDELQASRLQREPEVGLAGGPVSSQFESQLGSLRGGGSPLDHGMRSQMEGAFGASFEDVRVHSGSEAASLNRSISGKAFTSGSDIVLGETGSAHDSGLMAHELTHVVQQRSMAGSGGPMTVTAAGDAHEQEADAAAAVVSGGGKVAQAARQHETE